MCSRHRPEEGADSEPVEQPMTELPRANRDMVTRYVREHLGPAATEQQVLTEVNKVVMADALGRAIHAAKRIGGPWGPACSRIKPSVEAELLAEPDIDKRRLVTNDDFEQVPYGYEGIEFDCLCESMALHLVELMQVESVIDTVKSGEGRIVLPRGVIQ